MLENLKKTLIGFKDYDCHISRYRLDEIILRVREVRCRMNFNKKIPLLIHFLKCYGIAILRLRQFSITTKQVNIC